MRILIVDDHALVRAGIVLLLSRLGPECEAVEVAGVEEALALGSAVSPPFDLVLLDLNLQGMKGLDGLRDIRQAFPAAAVVILSGVDSQEAMREARAKGALGYIVKAVSADAMLDALRQVLEGQPCFPSIDAASGAQAKLTPRQREILRLLCEGRANKEIALELGMSDNTVRSHLTFIFRELGAHTRTEVAFAARRLGLI